MSQVTLLRRGVYLVAAKRTPFGTFGGKLKDVTATDLGVESATAALAAGEIDPKDIDSVIYGNVAQTSADAIYMARHIGLRSGVPLDVPGLVVNRLCGSGFQALATGAMEIEMTRHTEIVLTGGCESMSQSPFAARNLRWGVRLGQSPQLEDTLWAGLTDSYCGLPMGITAENLADEYSITREQADAFGLRSQQRWAAAHASGAFAAELAPITIKSRRGEIVFDTDEHPKPESTPESMAKLPTSFKKDGTVTAANASGICDGAASVVLASEEAVHERGFTPLARLVGFSSVGVEPTVMGIGPVPAIQTLLHDAGVDLGDVGMVEVNEAFAPQALSVQKVLGIDDSVFNIHGGAIALGHPLGASGARIMAHLAHSTANYQRYAVGSACIGGGMGMAMLLEK
eukprot:m.85426 g.85426  ORF g.85426 m.85426 type:complete len:400 (+) comp9631_c0_seq1:42-1241(+)